MLCDNMSSVVINTNVKPKDSDNAVVIAITSHAVFESGAGEIHNTEYCERGIAFPFILAMQRVNERLLEKNPDEKLLFDVILLSNEREESHSRIIASTKYYGLDIGRFCFCRKEDTIETLLSNKVKLFLSTDTNDVAKGLQRDLASALLHQQLASHSSEQLKVLFSGDAFGIPEDALPHLNPQYLAKCQLDNLRTAQESIKKFAALIGDMKRKFAMDDSPLCTGLITVWGTRDVSARALKTLRTCGLVVDEAHCLAGAPQEPILSLVKPHVVFTVGL